MNNLEQQAVPQANPAHNQSESPAIDYWHV
jgi:hypothetical protein